MNLGKGAGEQVCWQRMKMGKVALCSYGGVGWRRLGFTQWAIQPHWGGLSCVERCGHSGDRRTWHLNED